MKNYARIDLSEPTEVTLWSEALGVGAEDLRRAVSSVGDRGEDVVRYLLDRHAIKSPALVAALSTLRVPYA